MHHGDTIAAISSATGPAARMIVRISGPAALALAEDLGVAATAGASVRRGNLQFSDLSCPAWIYQFVSPRSFTGENLVELHIPGNPLLARMLLDWLVVRGARLADAGEFTARAFFNGKLDLSQAEGIATAIAAQGDLQLLAARRLMAGELAQRIQPTMDLLAETLALIEAGIDFSEEQMEFIAQRQIAERIDAILDQLKSLTLQSRRLEKLTHEPTIVLAGRPNAGKSTLTNALAGQNRSIVSAQAGTTRDALSVEISLPRGAARLIDIAGISGQQSAPTEEIDQQMQNAAWQAMRQADVLVLVREAGDPREEIPVPRAPDLRVISKIDLCDSPPQAEDSINLSAITGAGMVELRNALDRIAFGSDAAGASLGLTSRHRQALDEAMTALARAKSVLAFPELLAAEMRSALDCLGQILGIVSPDDIIGKIFSKFCIGK